MECNKGDIPWIYSMTFPQTVSRVEEGIVGRKRGGEGGGEGRLHSVKVPV